MQNRLKQFIASHTPDVLISPQVQQKIADLAYLLHEERGKKPGGELDAWREAERKILGRKAG